MALKGDDIASRLMQFAVRIVKMADVLPRTGSAKQIASQLVRSGTSAGANYEEARGAESQNDFVHKLGICLKELRETRYWLRIIKDADLLPATRMTRIVGESKELCRIIGQSILTAKKKTRQ